MDIANRPSSVTDPAPVEQWLSATIASYLKLKSAAELGPQTPAELGIESLKAIALQYQIQATFNVTLPIQDLLGRRTIRELAVLIAGDPACHRSSTGPTESEVLL